MIIANVRTPAGLVNGALGTLVAVLPKDKKNEGDTISGAVSASDVEYAVVDFPKYTGPVIFPEHPTWVPVEPFRASTSARLGDHHPQKPGAHL